MKIQILQVAATKDKNILALEKEFEKRLSPFAQMETITVMSHRGTQLSSEELAEMLKK